MSTIRSIQTTIKTVKGGFELKVKETETIKDDETGEAHTESEKSGDTFASIDAAKEGAARMVDQFKTRLPKPDGELFA